MRRYLLGLVFFVALSSWRTGCTDELAGDACPKPRDGAHCGKATDDGGTP